MPELSSQVAQILLQIEAVVLRPQKPFTFKSGLISPVYVDNRILPFYPSQWKIIIEGFQQLIQTQAIEFDVLAGVAVGGVPHSSALGYLMQKPSIFIRKEAKKEYGKEKRIEGGEINNKQVLLVEDLVTSGGSSLSGVQALHEEGAIVTDILAIVSFGFESAQQNFKDASINLHTLTNFTTIINHSNYNLSEKELIHDWFTEPNTWAERHGFV